MNATDDNTTGTTRRGSGRPARRRQQNGDLSAAPMVAGSTLASAFRPLDDAAVSRIHRAALDILETIGVASPTPRVLEASLQRGCTQTAEGRLLFPRGLVEDCLATAARSFVVHGRDPRYDFEAVSGRVNFCTGGAAVTMLDPGTRTYRPSTLRDLYDLARLCDVLENIQWVTRPVVATDVADPFALDANTVYACAAGTSKHIATSFSQGSHVADILPMLDLLAGGEGRFAQRPFCTVHATTIVSPLTFAPDSLDVACAAIDIGMPIQCQTGPQSGATAPAALAGTLAQICAEGLASLSVINLLRPGHSVVLGNWPFVSDLRTGAFSGGGGEQALLGAACGQMATFYGIPGGGGAGMTDSKLPDAQAGFEKGITLTLAALSGCGFVYESAGMLASLLGCSFEAMVIDDDMLSTIRRIARGIEVSDDTLSVDLIARTVNGEGHYLGAEQTLALMESEYTYPRLADRRSPADWADAGAADIRERAAERARDILGRHRPQYIAPEADQAIRAAYAIHLEPDIAAETQP